MHTLVLVRHGQSEWNLQNRFTGWTDVDLTDTGRQEAVQAAQALRAAGIEVDMTFTSYLKRAIKTLWIMLEAMDRMWLPVVKDWRLNERHYGALQGLNKEETRKDYGEDQVFLWRRSFETEPPPLSVQDARHPVHDPRYAHLSKEQLPSTESLRMTIDRVLPLWHEQLAHSLRDQTVLVCAHGNSLRGLVKYLDHISDEEISQVEIPTGIPLIYTLDEELRPVDRKYLTVEEGA